MTRVESVLEQLPPGYIFDGEIVCLDEGGKPVFNDLLFRKREPVYEPFDVLNVEGADVAFRAAVCVMGVRLPNRALIIEEHRPK